MTRIESVEIDANGMVFTAEASPRTNAEMVIFLHGFPQTRHAWRAELAGAVAAGFDVCAPDQRGYSAGARPSDIDDYLMELLVGDVMALADSLDAPHFHLVGHDWGGQLAWITSALHPERIRSLTVLSRPHPAAFVEALSRDGGQSRRSGHHQSFLRAEATDELLADDAAALRAIYRRNGVPAADAAAYLETLGEPEALDAAINWYRAADRSSIKAAKVPTITVPTLYVWGDADSTVGRVAAEATASMVDNSYRFVELAGVGHFITDQVPGVALPLLLEHLRAS